MLQRLLPWFASETRLEKEFHLMPDWFWRKFRYKNWMRCSRVILSPPKKWKKRNWLSNCPPLFSCLLFTQLPSNLMHQKPHPENKAMWSQRLTLFTRKREEVEEQKGEHRHEMRESIRFNLSLTTQHTLSPHSVMSRTLQTREKREIFFLFREDDAADYCYLRQLFSK